MSNKISDLLEKKVGLAVIINDKNHVLIAQRLYKDSMGGFWEFPGGGFEENETIIECVTREIKEELDLEIEVGEHLITVNYDYTTFKVILITHVCKVLAGVAKPMESEAIKWVEMSELKQINFPPASFEIVDKILDKFSVYSD